MIVYLVTQKRTRFYIYVFRRGVLKSMHGPLRDEPMLSELKALQS